MPPKFQKKRKQIGTPRSVHPSKTVLNIRVSIPILETTAPIGTIHRIPLSPGIPSTYKLFSSFKVLRVGIEINPYSYMEFVVREHVPATSTGALDSRQELLRQQDVVAYRNMQGEKKVFWYKPLKPVYRGWQQVDQTPEGWFYLSGLEMAWNATNELTAGTDGIIGAHVYDIVFQGLTQ